MRIPAEDKAFTHKPGVAVAIPKTLWSVTAYPKKLAFAAFDGSQKEEILLPLTGPVEGFTVEADYTRDRVLVFGRAKEGYYKVKIFLEEGDLVVVREKGFLSLPAKSVVVKGLPRGEEKKERIYFGNNKAKVFEKIRERKDLTEIFPLWHSLGRKVPKMPMPEGGSCSLFCLCEEKKDPLSFIELYLGAFSEGFVPRRNDSEYQGIMEERNEDPSYLLSFVADLIFSLFFQEEGNGYHFLPGKAPFAPCGKVEKITTSKGDLITFTWSKYKVHTVIIQALEPKELHLYFPKEIRLFRLKRSLREKGEVLLPGTPICLKKGERIFLDRFEK